MTMRLARSAAALAALAVGAAACGVSETSDGSDYPTRTIEVIVPQPPGGGADTLARTLVDAVNATGTLSEDLQVVNREGGGGVVGVGEVLRAKPDGYTISIAPEGPLTLQPLVADVGYEPLDMSPIAQIANGPVAIAVPAKSPYRTIDDLVTAAKASPGTISFGEGPLVYAVAVAQLEKETGTSFKHVDYEGDAASTTALLGGNLDVTMTQSGAILPQVKAGKLRVLAVGSEERSSFLADTPTLKEEGIDVLATGAYGVFGPKGLPDDVVKQLSDAFTEAVKSPEFTKVAEAAGLPLEPADGPTLLAYYEARIKVAKQVIEESGGKL